MALNLCQFMGNLGQDPDLRFLPDGRAVANISIACGKKWKDKQTGEIKEHTEWIRAVIFGKRAEVVADHFKKGSQIYISGEQRTRSYEKDGIKHYATEIVAHEFQFCGQRVDGSGDIKANQQASAYDQQGATNNQSGASQRQSSPPDYDDFDDDIPF